MPIIASIASICARAFGFLTGALRDSVVFSYVGFYFSGGRAYPSQIYGSDSDTIATATDIGWTFAAIGGAANGECGIIADGLLLGTARALSNNGGVTWTDIQVYGTSYFDANSYTGTNATYTEGLIAYNPTAKVMARIASANNGDYPYVNLCYFTLWDLQTKTLVSATFLGAAGPDSIVYSAPQNQFLVRGYNYYNYVYSLDGTTGGLLGSSSFQLTYPSGTHPTLGYLFYVYAPPAYQFGVYQGARISSSPNPLSSYTDLGATTVFSYTQSITKPIWCPVNNIWLKTATQSSTGLVNVYSSPTGAVWSFVAQALNFGASDSYAFGVVIKETSAGVIYISGMGPPGFGWARSTNGGVTWSTPVYGSLSSLTPNLNP
jgi:hypothetical protein